MRWDFLLLSNPVLRRELIITGPFDLSNEFCGRLGYYVVIAGHIEHSLHEMLTGWRSGLLLQDEIKARKSQRGLLKAVRRMAQDLPAGLGDEVKSFCDTLDERSRFRHRAVHGAWFGEPGKPGVMNLYFSEGPAGHPAPEPVHITPVEVGEAIDDIQNLLAVARSLRDRIQECRRSTGTA